MTRGTTSVRRGLTVRALIGCRGKCMPGYPIAVTGDPVAAYRRNSRFGRAARGMYSAMRLPAASHRPAAL